MTVYEFSETNSGGSWWLSKSQYEALFAAGWKYEPSEYDILQRPVTNRKETASEDPGLKGAQCP
jgi:hypothetical protein